MSTLKRIGLRGALITGTILSVMGCGSSTNNDQGTSFTALGFYNLADGTEGDSGTIVYVNQDAPGTLPTQPIPLFVPIDKDPEEEGLQGGFIGLQNNLTSQFIRTVRMDCCYTVPGADPSLAIPCDSYNFTTVIQAAPAPGAETTGEEAGNVAYVQVEQVSPDLLSFLAVNQNLMPELPYRMTAECDVVGVSQAGDVFTTNLVNYQIQFAEIPENFNGVVAPPFSGNAGGGGDINTFGDGGTSSASSAAAG